MARKFPPNKDDRQCAPSAAAAKARKPSSPAPASGIKQSFAFTAPEAQSVLLVGDFTRWQHQPISMQKESNGCWQTDVELKPGTYHYRFLVDGRWREDPKFTLRIPNPCGSQDCMRQLAES